MSNRIKELQQERGELVQSMRAISDKAGTEKRALTSEEDAEWTRLDTAQEGLKTTIEREQRQAELDREMATAAGRPVSDPLNPGKTVSGEEHRAKYDAAFRAWAVGGNENLDAEQRQILAASRAPAGELRAQSVGTASAGGYSVPQGFQTPYERALKDYSGVIQACRILPTDSGNTLPWPTINDTAQSGEQLAENTAAASQDMTFGVLNLAAYKYSSKIILVSMELMQDTGIDLEGLIGEVAGERIGRILNQRFTTGTGSSQPNGIVTAATTGVTLPSGNTLSLTYAGLVDLTHSVDPAYRRNPSTGFMMNDLTLALVKKIVDSQGRPLWLAGLNSGQPDTILGYKFSINQDMAVAAANAKTIAFGDMSKYIVRQVRGVFLFRFQEKYMDAGQIGFLAFARYDGNLLNAGTNPIKLLVQSAT